MADRIKGITVQIGGNIKPLDEALKGANKTISATQTELKEVQRLLKLDPKNAEMLKQKHETLNKEIEATKDKLKTLKEAEKQVQEQFKQGKFSEEQYKALQREIAETEGRLKSLKKTAAEAMVETGKRIESVGKGISKMGDKLKVPSMIATGLGTAAIKTAADFEAGMSKVGAISDASAQDMELLTAKAREMGKTTKFSATEAAEAMSYMAMAGWKSEDMLGGIEGIMHLAAAAGEDLGTTSDIVTDALTAFGMQAKDSGHFADVLAKAAFNANTDVAKMGETFKYVAPIAGTAGYSIEDVALGIGLMANQSIKASQAGTSLRAIMSRMATQPKQTAAAMGELGVSIADANGNMKPFGDVMEELRGKFKGLSEEERIQMASMIAGQEAMSGFLAIIDSSDEDFYKLKASIDDSAGAAKNAAEAMQDNLMGRVTELKSKTEDLAIAFGNLMIPALEEIVEKVSDFVTWLSELDEGQQQTIITIGLVVAAAAPLLSVLGKTTEGVGWIITKIPTLVSGFGSLVGAIPGVVSGFMGIAKVISGGVVSAFSKLTGSVLPGVGSAFSSLISFIVSNPIAAIVAAVVAAVATIALKGDEIQALLQKVDDWLQGVFAKDWTEVFGPVLGGALNIFVDYIKDMWDSIKRVLDGIIDFIRGVFTGDWERAWGGIKDIFGGVWDGIFDKARNVIGAIQSLIDGIGSAIDWARDKISNFSFDLPDWDIPFFANGGSLTKGNAIVGEAGPELLTVQNGRAIVQPLTGPHAKTQQITQNNYFNNYQPRDGAAAVRDLNRQLGWEF